MKYIHGESHRDPSRVEQEIQRPEVMQHFVKSLQLVKNDIRRRVLFYFVFSIENDGL